MDLLLIAAEWPDRTIPWAGIGAILLGVGSVLSGLAAYKSATRRGNNAKPKDGGSDS